MTTAGLTAVPQQQKVIGRMIRVSKIMGRSGPEFISPDLQDAKCIEVIERAGHIVGPKFIDLDESGRDWNRDGLNNALRLKASGEIDGIAVLKLNRVGRTAIEVMKTVQTFKAGNGAFLSYHERIDDGPAGAMVLAVLATLAEVESDEKSTNWRDAIQHRAKNGHHNGPPPVGAKRIPNASGKGTRIVLDDTAAFSIAEAFTRYDAGEVASAIERDLSARGVISAKSPGVLKRHVLQNPFYLGQVRLRMYEGVAKDRVSLGEQLVVPGAHPALLVVRDADGQPVLDVDGNEVPDVELFERVQQRLASEKRSRAASYASPVHPLRGLVKCGTCGRGATYFTDAQTRPHYRCHDGRAKTGCDGCGSPAVVDVVEHVRATVREQWQAFDLGTENTRSALARKGAAVAARKKVARDLDKLVSVKADLGIDRRLGEITKEEHDAMSTRIDERLSALRVTLDAMEPLVEGPSVQEFCRAAQRLDDEWDTATQVQRNAMLRAAGVVAVELVKVDAWRPPIAQRVIVTLSV